MLVPAVSLSCVGGARGPGHGHTGKIKGSSTHPGRRPGLGPGPTTGAPSPNISRRLSPEKGRPTRAGESGEGNTGKIKGPRARPGGRPGLGPGPTRLRGPPAQKYLGALVPKRAGRPECGNPAKETPAKSRARGPAWQEARVGTRADPTTGAPNPKKCRLQMLVVCELWWPKKKCDAFQRKTL